MTSTGTYQGLLDGRNSSKVLKPPGGGSSDIFGAGESNSPRRNKPSQQCTLGSSFFNADNDAQQPAQKGPPSNNHILGSSFFNADNDPRPKPASNGSSVPDTPRSKPDGNPVTGAGYELSSTPQQNGNGSISSAASDKSSTDSSPSVGTTGITRMKNRVPPGGFSSGLW